MTSAFGAAHAACMSPPGRPTDPTAASAEAAVGFAQTLARVGAAALRDPVAGGILHGSSSLDDYRPGRSDLDLLVVVDHPSATPGWPR
jgi:Nucleotidyltransferase domain